jgi:putative hydrolase of the HAD superfamily
VAQPQAVVFDFGGVMTGEPRKELVVQFLTETFGLGEEDWEKIRIDRKRSGLSDEEFWLGYAQQTGTSLPTGWREEFRAALRDAIGVNPRMYALVEELKGQVRVGMLSNIDERLAGVVRSLGLYEPFNPLLLSYEMGVEKPEARAYQMLLEALQLPANAVVFIDDKIENVRAARQLGIDAIWFQGEQPLRAELAQRGFHSVGNQQKVSVLDREVTAPKGKAPGSLVMDKAQLLNQRQDGCFARR